MQYIIANRGNRLFIILSAFFITNALIAEFMGVKIFSLESTLGFQPFNISLFGEHGLGFNLTAGVLLWPVVFVMTDIINEYFGQAGVRFLSYMTAGLIAYAFLMMFFAIHLVPSGFWPGSSGQANVPDMQGAYTAIFGQSNLIIIGSLVAFLVGQFVDVTIFHKIKDRTGEKMIWLRSTGSTLVSQLVDSYIVLVIAFYFNGKMSLTMVLAIGTVNYFYKFVVALLLTPVIYIVHEWIERYLGHDLASKMKQEAMKR